jgi:dUTPase
MKLGPNSIIPKQATLGSAGFDVQLTTPITIQPEEIAALPTGLSTALPKDLSTALPKGMYIRIAPRSSLAL